MDVLWAVGPLSEDTARAARAAGLRNVHWSEDVPSALEQMPIEPQSGDVMLFKASRGVRIERVYDAVKACVTACVTGRRASRPQARPTSEPKSDAANRIGTPNTIDAVES